MQQIGNYSKVSGDAAPSGGPKSASVRSNARRNQIQVGLAASARERRGRSQHLACRSNSTEQ